MRVLGPDDVREIDESLLPIHDPEVKAAARRLIVTARRSASRSAAAESRGEISRGVE